MAAFPVGDRGKALAIFFGVSGGLTAIGPILGGYLTHYTWRAIFWVNIPVAIIAVILTFAAKVRADSRPAKMDWLGAALIVAGMGLSVLGLQQAQSWGWTSPWTWACIVAGFALLVVFVLLELRTPVPLIKVRIFKDRAFTIDNAVLFFAMMAFIPLFFFASVYSQVSLGLDAGGAGLYLLIFFAGFVVAAQIGGRMLDRGGAKLPVIIGCVVGAVGFALWGAKLTDLSEGAQWPYIVLAGAGIGFLLGPASTDAVNRAIDASYGEATGITQTLRNYGSSLGLAILGTVLLTVTADRFTRSLAGFGVPEAQARRIADSMSQSSGTAPPSGASAVPPQLREQIAHAIQLDYAKATQVVFWGMAGALVISLLFAIFHPGGKVTGPSTSDEPTAANVPVGREQAA